MRPYPMRRLRFASVCLAMAVAACQAEPPVSAPTPATPSVAVEPAPVPASASAGSVSAPSPSPAGRYEATTPAPGTLTLSEAGDGAWHITLRGGAVPDGASTAADCELEARGPLVDGRIAADVVPFEGTLSSVTEADLAREPSTVSIVLNGDVATVTTDYTQCALGADLAGTYTRVATP